MNDLTITTTGKIITHDLARNPAAVYVAGLTSVLSRRTMRHALDTIARMVGGDAADALTCPWRKLRYKDTKAIRAQLAERYAPATANKMLAALRGTLKEAWRLKLMTAAAYHAAVDVKTVKGATLPAGRSITPGELSALMDNCANDPTPAGARDGAMIALLYTCGLRRAEIAALDPVDYDSNTGELRIRGKGNKERLAHCINGAAAAMADWLAVRGDRPGALFLPIRKGGHLADKGLSTTAVFMILRRRAAAACVSALSPHDLRRTFVGDLLDAGADIVTVQHLAGHANVTTTARYDRRPEAAKRRATELLHIPYRRRRMVTQ